MKKIFKSRIFFLILGMIITTTIGVTASVIYNSSEIGFTPSDTNWKVNNLQDAVNDLYKGKSTAVQVATLTTQGATYTMQNDGYVAGTVQANVGGGFVYFNGTNRENIVYYTNSTDPNVEYHASIYAPKGTVISTRANYGIYNLTVYEWK